MAAINQQQTAEKIVRWLQEQAKKANAAGVVFGMSGGIDSSVVAVLCNRAFPDNCLGLLLPCNSDSTDAQHAKQVAEKFDIKYKTVDLLNAFECISKDLKAAAGSGGNEKIAIANIKPRLRMVSLYYLANKLNYLVIGTDNKVELMVGYFTKFGDGGVDLLPLAGLFKGEVRQLALHLGIPKEIIEKPPSAGLWQGQTDEGEIGLTYEQLDNILEKIDQNDTGGVQPEELEKVKAMLAASQHKRSLPPVFEKKELQK